MIGIQIMGVLGLYLPFPWCIWLYVGVFQGLYGPYVGARFPLQFVSGTKSKAAAYGARVVSWNPSHLGLPVDEKSGGLY